MSEEYPAEPLRCLRAWIAERLVESDAADPKDVADELLLGLEATDVTALAVFGLRALVGEVMRSQRRGALTREATSPRSKKWEMAAAVSKSRPDLFGVRVVVGVRSDGTSVYAFLGDCTAEMLHEAGLLLRSSGRALFRRAAQYEALAGLVGDGVTVRALPDEVVAECFA